MVDQTGSLSLSTSTTGSLREVIGTDDGQAATERAAATYPMAYESQVHPKRPGRHDRKKLAPTTFGKNPIPVSPGPRGRALPLDKGRCSWVLLSEFSSTRP